MTLATTTAAINVDCRAANSQMPLCETLLNGIYASKDSPKLRMTLTALNTIAGTQSNDSSHTEKGEDEGEVDSDGSRYDDVCRCACYLPAANEHEEYVVLKDHALVLVLWWENRKRSDDITFRNDFIEALLLPGSTILERKDGQQTADTALDHA